MNLNRYPFVRLLFPLVVGICFQYYLTIPFNFIYISLLLFTCLLIITFSKVSSSYKYRWVWGTILFALVLSTGINLVQTKKKNSDLPHNINLTFTGVLTSHPQEKEKSVKLDLKVHNYLDSCGNWKKCKENIIVYIKADSSLILPKAGDALLCKTLLTEIPPPQNPYEFDYRAYMAQRGVFSTAFCNANRFEVIAENQLPVFKRVSLNIQKYVFETFKRAGISDNALAVITALTIGDKQYLDPDIKQSFRAAGIFHILAVSGLHIGILFGALSLILSFLNNRKRYGKALKTVIILIVLWIYAAVVGFSPSVTRATAMFSILLFGQLLSKQRNTYNTIAASAFIILIANPYALFEVGFQLSYAAVLGIVYFQPKLYNLLYFKNKLVDKLWSITNVTLAAQITTTPIVLYNFHQFPAYFLPSNLVLIFFTTLIIYLAFILITFSWIPIVLTSLGWLVNKGLLILNKSVEWIENLPYALIDGIYINATQCYLLVICILLIAVYWLYRNINILYVTIVTLIALFGINIHHQLQINKQQSVTVYSVNNSTFINFIEGKYGYSLKDTLHINDYFDYQTKNHLIKQGFSSARKLNQLNNCDSLPFAYHNFISFDNKIFYFAERPIKPTENKNIYIAVDYLLVSQRTRQKPDELLNIVVPKEVIIDSSTPRWKAQQWIAATSELNIKCHWVKRDKAFTIEN